MDKLKRKQLTFTRLFQLECRYYMTLVCYLVHHDLNLYVLMKKIEKNQ
jgi:hypothetical protein